MQSDIAKNGSKSMRTESVALKADGVQGVPNEKAVRPRNV